MSSDFTEHQSDDELRKARKLSVEPTRPPAKVEGYSIQGFIGRGSYGEVWAAIDQKTGKRVAIKFYAQRSSVDVRLLAQEVEKLVVLAADRYVVQLLDVGWDASPPYYVMDFIESGSLEDRIKGESIPVARAVEVFKEVATGLMHLHGKGVLHCDLKPGNVLLDQDGKPRLADFGQSRLKTDVTSALGTLFYMAPEQADLRSAPDAKWDVYALGALLFTMLTGKPPYYSEELKQKIENAESLQDRLRIYRHSLSNARLPQEHRNIPGVDRSLGDIIDRCIAAKPSNRFASAQSVLAALQQREIKQQNWPLMILGILGPILLLLVMSLFGGWAFRQATSDAEKAIIQKANDSNEFAAQLAARSAAEQLDEYFRIVQQVSRDSKFLEAMDKLLADEKLTELRDLLSDPKLNGHASVEERRKEFVAHAARRDLQAITDDLLNDPMDEYPEAASWFVTDIAGNQIAGTFDNGKSETVGKNYAYRTYFTGRHKDLDRDEVGPDPLSRTMIAAPHLSASFLSDNSGLRKVAFSTPVRGKNGKMIGIVATTVNLGNLVEFNNSYYHYVMLVDDRAREFEADKPGIILEHPLFNEARRQHKNERLPEELAEVTIEMDNTQDVGLDPLGATSIGKTYRRNFIIAKAAVKKKHELSLKADSLAETGRSGIFVVAFEDYDSVLQPSRDLGDRLGRLAMLAFLILLSLAVGMWMLVRRIIRESRRRLVNAPAGDTMGTFGGSSVPASAGTASNSTAKTARGSRPTE